MKKRLPLIISALCVIMSSYVYGQSDICDASTMMLAAGVNSGTNVGETADEDFNAQSVCTSADFDAQTWYQFNATSNSAELTFTSTGITDASIFIVSACGPCAGPDHIIYYTCDVPNGATEMVGICTEPFQDYWIGISSALGDEGTFEIEVDQSANFDAPNSDCSNPTTISSGMTIVNNYCTTQNFMFFEYMVQTGPAISISTSNNQPITPVCNGSSGYVVFPDCTDAESVPPFGTLPITECLAVGQTVIIRVDIALPYPVEINIIDPDPSAAPAEPNDVCTDAFDIYSGNPITCSASAGISGNGAACPDIEGAGCNDTDPGIWGFFTVDPSVPAIDVTGSGFQLFEGPDCSNLNSLICDVPTSGIIPDPNTTYFVLVTGDGNNNFNVTTSPNMPSNNDDCADAVGLVMGNNNFLNNLCGTTDDPVGSCGAAQSESTVWYQYTTSGTLTSLEIAMVGVTIVDPAIAVYDGCGGTLLGESCDETVPVVLDCGVSGTVWIQVGSTFTGQGDFELDITEGNLVNMNDLCADAATDPENTLTDCTLAMISGDNTNSCPESFSLAGCNVDTEPTVWEELTLPAGTVSLEFSNIAAGFNITVWGSCGGAAFLPSCLTADASVPVPGGTTSVLVSVSSPAGSEGAYSFDVLPVVPPTNDSCLFPDDPLAGTLTNACATADLASGCTPVSVDESTVWYEYNVSSSITSITIDLTATTITGQTLNIYDAAGGCTSLVLLGQDCAGATVTVDCPPVGPLLIMVGSAFADTGEFTLAITEGPGSALNDLCADATDAGTLPDCMDVNIVGSTLNSCPENFTLAGCNIDVDPTTWYQFTLPAGATAIQVSNIALTSAGDLELTLWDACPTAGTAQAPVCFNTDQIFTGATGGATYFVSASSTAGNEGGFSFDVLAIVPPANDMCADAIAPTGTLTNVCATADVAFNGCAPSQAESTVWYVYNIANPIDEITITLAGTGTAISSPAFMVLDGTAGCPGTFLDEACAEGDIVIECPPTGDIFIMVGSAFDNAGEFTLTITEGNPTPLNDLCTSATAEPALAACTPQGVSGTNEFACPEDFTLSGCNIDVDPTVWHEVTVPAGTTAIELEVTSGTILLTLWDACPSASGQAIGTVCISANAVNLLPVPGAGTYYISVGSPSGNEGPYSFDITAIVPPSNDECANADPASVGTTVGNNICATVDAEPNCTSSTNSGMINTVWYEYVIPADAKSITISVAGSGADPMTGDIHVAALDGCPPGANLYQTSPDSETCDGSDIVLTCPTPGETVFILVGSLSADEGEFTITITEDNPNCTYTNDECDMAEALPVDPITNMGEECISGCNELACPDPEIDGVCGTTTSNVVWFTVTTDGFDPTIETFISATVSNEVDFAPVVGIFTGSCPPVSALTSIGCNAAANVTITNSANAGNHPMPNTTYYIAVANSDDTQPGGTFDLCVEVLQGCANDDCDNPLTLSDGVTQVTTTSNCTDDFLLQACGAPSVYEATAWYSYTVPAGVTAILVEATGATGNLVFDIGLDVDCNDTQPIPQPSDYSDCNFSEALITCVIEGEVYTLFFGSEIVGVDFEVTVTGLPPTDPQNPSPDNDLCDNPTMQTLSDQCELETITFDNISACPEALNGVLSDLGTSCDFDLDPTVWFELTLPLDATGLEFDNISNGSYLAVFDPNCPVGGPLEDCMDQSSLVPVLGLTGGNSYFVAVANATESNSHSFDVLAITQPPNDDACPTAMFPPADVTGGAFMGTTCCALGFNDNMADFENLTSITNCGSITQDNTVWFTYQFIDDGSDAIQIDFNNIGIQGGAAIEVYVVDDINEACDGVLTIGNGDVVGWACDAVNDDPIQIGCPDPDRFYLIKLTTTDDECGEYSLGVSTINSSCEYADEPCDVTDVIMVTTPPDFSLVFSCVPGCLEFACPEDPLPPGDPCVFQDNPTVWFQASLDDIAAQMFTTVTTDGTWQPVWSVYVGDTDCDNLIQLGGGMGGGPPCSDQDNTPDLHQLAVESDFDNVWIAVSADGEVDDPNFEFCIATTINAIVCLGDINDNCEPEAEFIANTEDMADDPGPFCPGEEVEICIDFFYDATESGADWLIGIVPVFGGGWDLTNFDPVGDAPTGSQWYDENGGCAPILQEPLPHMCTFTNSNGNLELCNALCDACPCTPGMSQDEPLPSGWFWVSNGGNAGCDNDCSPGEGWGIGSTTSQINFCFTLEVKEFETEVECGTPPNNDLQISFQSFSDGVAGCWEDPVAECLIDRAQFSPAWEVDCNFSPPAEADPVLICSGDITDILTTIQGGFNGVIEVEISDETSPNILGQNEYMFTGGGGTITDELINCGTIVDTAKYVAYATVDGFECPGPPFLINVPVSPKIVIDPQPNPYVVCLPHTIENLPANISGGSGSYPTVEWYWNGGGAPIGTGPILSSYTLSMDGFIEIQVTDSDGCMETHILEVDIFEKLEPEILIDATEVCKDVSFLGASASVSAGQVDDWFWYTEDADGNPINIFTGGNTGSNVNIDPSDPSIDPGKYTIFVEASNDVGCVGIDSVCLTIYPLPNGVIVQQPSANCDSEVELCIEFYDANGNDIYGNGPDDNNNGIPDLFEDANGDPDFTITWYANFIPGGSTTNELCFLTTTQSWYDAEIESANGCIGLIGIDEIVLPMSTAPTIEPDTICIGEISTLTVMPQNYDTYEWEDVDGNPIGGGSAGPMINVMPLVSSTYFLTVTDANNCTGEASVTVEVNPLPDPQFSGNLSICAGQETEVTALGDPALFDFNWLDGAGTSISMDSFVVISTTGTYTLELTNEFGCSKDTMFMVNTATALSINISGSDICDDDGCTTLNGGAGFDDYEWIDMATGMVIASGPMEQTLEVCDPGDYILNAFQGVCSGSDTITINQVDSPVIDIADGEACNITSGGSLWYVDFESLVLSSGGGTWSSLTDPSISLSPLDSVSFAGLPMGDYEFIYTSNTAVLPCADVSDTITISVGPCDCPNPNVNNPTDLCNADDNYNLNNLIGPNTDFGQWVFLNGPETATLDGDTMFLFNGVMPGMYEFAYELVPVPIGTCTELADTISITVVEPPVAEIEMFACVCETASSAGCNNGSTMLNLDDYVVSGSGTWLDPGIAGLAWTPPMIDFAGLPLAPVVLTFQTNDAVAPCTNVEYTLTVDVTDCNCPNVSVGTVPDICNDDAVVDLSLIEDPNIAPGAWVETATNPSTGNLSGSTVTLTGQPAGLYIFTYVLSSPVAGCDTESVPVIISVSEPPSVTVMNAFPCNVAMGMDSTTIDLNTLVSDPSIGVWTDATGAAVMNTYLDFDGQPIGTVVTYTFTTNIAVAPCMDQSYTVDIEVADCDCPTFTFEDPPLLCSDDGSVDLDALVLAPTPPGFWTLVNSPAGSTASLDGSTLNATGTVAGVYTVSYNLTDAPQGCTAFETLDVTVSVPAVAELESNFAICNTNTNGEITVYDLNDAVMPGGEGGVWTDEDGMEITNTEIDFLGFADDDFTYTYTLASDMPCDPYVGTITITAGDCSCPVVFDLDTYCSTGGTIELFDIFNIVFPGTWVFADGSPVPNAIIDYTGFPDGVNTVFFEMDDPGATCLAQYPVNFNIVSPADLGEPAEPLRICEGENVVVNLLDLLPDAPAGGMWIETSVDGSTPGAFDGTAGTFTTGNESAANYSFQYEFQSLAPCPEVAETVQVIIEGLPTAEAGETQTLTCDDNMAELGDDAITSQGINFMYQWTEAGGATIPNDTESSIVVSESGVYTLVVTDINTGCSVEDIVTVNVDGNIPSVSATATEISCFGAGDGTIEVQVTGGEAPIQYSIDGGVTYGTSNVFNNLGPGNFAVSIIDDNGCETGLNIEIEQPERITVDLGNDITLSETLTDTLLTFTSNYPVDQIANVVWTDEDGVILCEGTYEECREWMVGISAATVYCVEITNTNGCIANDCIQIRAIIVEDCYVPNIFSPNDDGQNDAFFMQCDQYATSVNKFFVFDRWGEMVYGIEGVLPNDPLVGWDGTMNDEDVEQGVYAYYIEVEFNNDPDNIEIFAGDITVVR